MNHLWLLKILLGLVVLGCSMADESIYDFKASVDGKEVSLDIYPQSGAKVLLIVNVNSVCNAAQEQFQLLNALHDKYYTQGLVILGFPNNQFGREEPDESHRVYGKELHFPVMDPVIINGPDSHPLFAHLRAVTGGTCTSFHHLHPFLPF
jgi:glutathione peroxidase